MERSTKRRTGAVLGLVLLLLAATTVVFALQARDSPDAPGIDSSEPVSLSPSPAPMSEPEIDSEVDPVRALEWGFGAPQDHGMDAALLQQLHAALQGTPVKSVVTVRDGVIVDEFYNDGYDEGSVFRLYSVTKSVTSALIGIAIEQGHIESADVPLSDYFPELLSREDVRWRQLSLRHLLTQTSGIDWPELTGSIWREYSTSPDWVGFVLDRPMVAQPGAVYEYSTGNSHLLTAVLEQATGLRGSEFARAHLFEPLGIESVRWRVDPQGVTDGGAGISMSARDAARFGQLYLQGGVWEERQLIPSWWVEESIAWHSSPSGRVSEFGGYGYQWWVRPFGADHDAFYAQGIFGQFVFVVPELNLVAVFASGYPIEGSWVPSTWFSDYVLAAVR